MRMIADSLMFTAGVGLGLTLFQSALYGVIAGAILAGATDGALNGKKRR